MQTSRDSQDPVSANACFDSFGSPKAITAIGSASRRRVEKEIVQQVEPSVYSTILTTNPRDQFLNIHEELGHDQVDHLAHQ